MKKKNIIKEIIKDTDNDKKTIRLELRLTKAENEKIKELANQLQLSKTDVVLKAISLLADEK